METKDIIGILQTIKSRENLSHEKSKKLFVDPQPNLGVEALEAAIQALRDKETYKWLRCSEWSPQPRAALNNGNVMCIDKEGEYWFIPWVDLANRLNEFEYWAEIPEPPEKVVKNETID